MCPNTYFVHLLLPPATPADADKNRYLSRLEESAVLQLFNLKECIYRYIEKCDKSDRLVVGVVHPTSMAPSASVQQRQLLHEASRVILGHFVEVTWPSTIIESSS